MPTNNLHPVQYLAYTLVSIALLLWLMNIGAFILVPLVWGVFFAFALYPISKWLESKRFPRSFAIAISILFVTIIGAAIIYILTNQMISLLSDIPEMNTLLHEKINRYRSELESTFGINNYFNKEEWQSIQWLDSGTLNQTIFNTGKSITLIGIIPLYIFLLLYYRDFFVAFLLKVSSERNEAILKWVADAGRVIHAYLIGMVKVTLFIALLSGLYFYFFGIKYYLLFALFIGILNLIPYIGVAISSLLVIFYVFLTSDTLLAPVLTLAVLWGIQLIENNLITPLVVGAKVKVNVLAVVLAVLVGGAVWGISGMVLFIPFVGILKITFDSIPKLQPYGYLLGDDFPKPKNGQSFIRHLKNKWLKK
ncbi:AI-2E family transporter [uncultured Cyclobacterium sp.]|uniref:AI-2E family transporter n=1 Tax=uncultured Cyclobacterium sp. TaxID=453820 RepID=UPI0030EC4487